MADPSPTFGLPDRDQFTIHCRFSPESQQSDLRAGMMAAFAIQARLLSSVFHLLVKRRSIVVKAVVVSSLGRLVAVNIIDSCTSKLKRTA